MNIQKENYQNIQQTLISKIKFIWKYVQIKEQKSPHQSKLSQTNVNVKSQIFYDQNFYQCFQTVTVVKTKSFGKSNNANHYHFS